MPARPTRATLPAARCRQARSPSPRPPGFKGLTLHASAPGLPSALLTLAGYDLLAKDSALSVAFGFDPGSCSNYVYDVAA